MSPFGIASTQVPNFRDMHRGCATMLYALVAEFGDELVEGDDALASLMTSRDLSPAYNITVPASSIVLACRKVMEQHGPQRLLDAIGLALDDQWTPAGVIFGTAQSVAATCRRFQALERVSARSVYSDIAAAGDRAVTIRRLPAIPEISRIESIAIAYWSYVLSAFRAAGCEGLRLEGNGALIFANGYLNPLAHLKLDEAGFFQLSWDRQRERVGAAPIHLRTTRERLLVNRVADKVQERFGRTEQAKVGVVSRCLGLSSRNLQRRLSTAGFSFGTIRRCVQLSLVTRHIGEPGRALEDIAMTTGFTDASHLTNVFKQTTGISPRGFSRNLLC